MQTTWFDQVTSADLAAFEFSQLNFIKLHVLDFNTSSSLHQIVSSSVYLIRTSAENSIISCSFVATHFLQVNTTKGIWVETTRNNTGNNLTRKFLVEPTSQLISFRWKQLNLFELKLLEIFKAANFVKSFELKQLRRAYSVWPHARFNSTSQSVLTVWPAQLISGSRSRSEFLVMNPALANILPVHGLATTSFMHEREEYTHTVNSSFESTFCLSSK